MDADGDLFRLVSEAKRISLAYLFDPFLAVHTSKLDPLPHQIEAVYGEMLPRQPLRFLLADDPGAGKTIMAGLFSKELMIRGDVERCLIVAPGSLVEQWQDELWQKFGLDFEILTKDMIEAARSGNPFAEQPLLIARLDHLSRNEDLQAKLAATDWDLVVVDEAHKMSAHYFGRRDQGDEALQAREARPDPWRVTLLLMTATPHTGNEEDFQLFMALLDADRFEGKPRDASHTIDASDLMRRMVKEKLLKFDGTPLFPERRAYTATYPLSDDEALLYERVTDYVAEEMNRADRLKAEGEGRRGAVVGFALTTLQRRLASSPEAIYQSLCAVGSGASRSASPRSESGGAAASWRAWTGPAADFRGLRRRLRPRRPPRGRARGARGRARRRGVGGPDDRRARARRSRPWPISRSSPARCATRVPTASGRSCRASSSTRPRCSTRRQPAEADHLHRAPRHAELPGRQASRAARPRRDAVVSIHGGMPREERRKVQEAFLQDKDVLVLVATDAAGEGINLQRAHLMVNYDLPWNPNRIEQRFGRVHRIGQTEVCHLWNLVAEDTREGQVFQRLFEKLEEQRKALGDQVFDVLGDAFRGQEPARPADRGGPVRRAADVKQRLNEVVDATVGDALRQVVHERALVSDVMTTGDVERIREEMERAEARKLQPHFIRSFFLKAFALLGGVVREREPGRFEITHVPAELRHRDRQIGLGAPLLRRYERVTFEKDLIAAGARTAGGVRHARSSAARRDDRPDRRALRQPAPARRGADRRALTRDWCRMCSSTSSTRSSTAGPTGPVTAGSSPSGSSSSASTPRESAAPPDGRPTSTFVTPAPRRSRFWHP